MPDLNPYRLIPAGTPPPPVQFGSDTLIAVRMIASDGVTILIDTTDAPVSVAELLSNCTTEDLAPVIEQYALTWLLKQRGIANG